MACPSRLVVGRVQVVGTHSVVVVPCLPRVVYLMGSRL